MRIEKRKARRAKLFQQDIWMGKRRTNHPDDRPAERESIIIITIYRKEEDRGLILLSLISSLPADENFYPKFSPIERQKNS